MFVVYFVIEVLVIGISIRAKRSKSDLSDLDEGVASAER